MTRTRVLAVFLALITVCGIAAPAAATGLTAQHAANDQTTGDQPAVESAFTLESFLAPESTAPGSNLTVVATIRNNESDTVTEPVEFRLEGDVVDRKYVTIEGGESAAVRLSTDTDDLDPNTYNISVFTETDGIVDNVTISESFDVEDLDAPESAEAGEEITVDAEIVNSNDFETTQNVSFRLDGDLVERQRVTLDEDESDNVSFDVDTSGLEAGTYTHGVFTRDEGELAEITIEAPENVTEAPENVTEEPENVTEAPENVTEAPENVTEAPENVTIQPDEGEEMAEMNATVTFEDQESNGTTVTVDEVNVSDGGYVAIHNESLNEGIVIDSVVGVSEYLEPGVHENVNVTLFDVRGADFKKSQLTENQTLIAMPHLETSANKSANVTNATNASATDNMTYDFVETNGTEDGPYVKDGRPVTDEAEITVTAAQNVTENVTAQPENVTEDPANVTENVTEEPENVTEEPENVTEEPENVTENVTERPGMEALVNVSFSDQDVDGQTVTVSNVSLERGGYVAIHNESLLDGDLVGSVIGVSEYVEPGEQTNVTIELFDVPGAEFEQTELNGSQRLFAMPHLETTGNEEFDFVRNDGREDGPYVAVQPVTDSARVTFAGMDQRNATDGNVTAPGNVTDEPANVTENATDENETMGPTANVTFENQTSNGSAVTVQNVTVSEGGYVAIHDATLLDGNTIGSVIGVSEYLEAGQHANVTISLFDVPGIEFSQSELAESQLLIAMPHQETNSNQTYDFVRTAGQEDGPYTTNGDPVTDSAEITLEGGMAANVTGDNVTGAPTANETQDNVTGDNATEDPFAVTQPEENETMANETMENETMANETMANETNETVVADTVGGDNATGASASVTFENQTTNGTVVFVQNVSLNESGYIAIHNDSLNRGVVVDSVIGVSKFLQPGEYQNVSVELYNVSGAEFSQSRLTENQTLIAMPHRETTGNQTYDFVATNGTGDPPFIAGGQVVTDDANVTVSNATTTTGNATATTG